MVKTPRKTGIYLLHFEPRYKHAEHYLGWAKDIQQRVTEHREGKSGCRLTTAAAQAGTKMFLVRTWPGGRKDERALKGFRGAKSVGRRGRLCPACWALKRALPRTDEGLTRCFYCGKEDCLESHI